MRRNLTIECLLEATETPACHEHSNERLKELCCEDEETWNHPATVALEFAAETWRIKTADGFIKLPHWEKEHWQEISPAYQMVLWANIWLMGQTCFVQVANQADHHAMVCQAIKEAQHDA